MKLWSLLRAHFVSSTSSHTFGCLDPVQVTLMAPTCPPSTSADGSARPPPAPSTSRDRTWQVSTAPPHTQQRQQPLPPHFTPPHLLHSCYCPSAVPQNILRHGAQQSGPAVQGAELPRHEAARGEEQSAEAQGRAAATHSGGRRWGGETPASSTGPLLPPPVDYLRPIIADGDTGHGGLTSVMRLTKLMVEAGAAGIHLEDQKPGPICTPHHSGTSPHDSASTRRAARWLASTHAGCSPPSRLSVALSPCLCGYAGTKKCGTWPERCW